MNIHKGWASLWQPWPLPHHEVKVLACCTVVKFGSWILKAENAGTLLRKGASLQGKRAYYGVDTPVGGTYRPRVPGAGWGQGTQSICICHFVYCFYLQEELKQKLNGVFLSPLNMNHSSKTNLTIEISKVRGSSNNPRAKAGGRGGCSRHRTYAQRCGSPARDRLPGRQAQDPFMRMPPPPTLENVSIQT